jgi:hypothetical protein
MLFAGRGGMKLNITLSDALHRDLDSDGPIPHAGLPNKPNIALYR